MATEDRLKETDWSLLKKFWAFVHPYRRHIYFAFFAVPFMTGLTLLQPYLLKVGIDEYILPGKTEGLGTLALTLLALVGGSYLLNGIQSYRMQWAVIQAIGDLRQGLFRHVMKQSNRFFDRHSSGALLTRSTTDVESLGEMVNTGMLGMFADTLMIIGIIVTMLSLNLKLTLLTFCVAPLVIFIVNICRRKLRFYGLQIRESLARLNGYLAEHLLGIRVVRAFGRAETSLDEFKAINFSYLTAYKRSNWYDASLYAVMDGLSSFCVALMLWYGGFQLLEGDDNFSLGLLVAFVEYTSRLFIPVRDLSGKVATLQRSMAAMERIFGLLEDKDEIPEGKQRLEASDSLTWQMQHVSFRYHDHLPRVLKDISLELKPGKSVALVGRTGSGKSTIGRLLTRTYAGYEGNILVGGTELSDINLHDLRRLVSVIHQDVFLFAGTIRDNIGLGVEEATDEIVVAAAKWVGAHEFIEKLPGGYDFEVKERGANLSAGQGQLIAFARAIAKDSPFLILDEATSNVDPSLEATIQETVQRIVRDKTVLLVAHRLSTIEAADEIIVLGDGAILERGPHQTLAKAGGPYQELLESGDNQS